MPVDASPYQRRTPPVNLLEEISQLKGAADTLGQIEVGKGMQQAIQEDGSVDRNILAQHLKGSVVGGMKAPEALTALEHLRGAGYATDQQGLRTLMEKTRFIGSAFGPLAGAGVKAVKQEELVGVAGKILKDAHKYGIKVPDVMTVLAETQGMDDVQRAQFVKQRVFQAQEASRVLDLTLRQTATVDTGDSIRRIDAGTLQNPAGFTAPKGLPPGQGTIDDRRKLPDGSDNPNYGQPQLLGPGGAGAPITKQSLSPTAPPPVRQAMENATVVSRGPTTDPRTGQVIADSSFDAIRQRGQRPAAGAGASPGSPPPAVVPQAAAPRAAAPVAPALTPAQQVAQRFPTGLPPGTVRTLEDSAGAFSERLKEAGTYAERINPLKSAEELLVKMPKGSTGPGTEGINKLRAALEVMNIPVPGGQTMNDYVKLHKYLEQNIAATAPAGTNVPGVMQSIASNPNTSQPKEALTDLVRVGIALTRMRQAATLEYKKLVDAGAPANNFNSWMAKWSTTQDPRAYVSDRIGKEGRAKLDKSLKGAEKEKFLKSYQSAKSTGVIDIP